MLKDTRFQDRDLNPHPDDLTIFPKQLGHDTHMRWYGPQTGQYASVSGNSVPRRVCPPLGTKHGPEEDDSIEGAIIKVCKYGGTESPATPAVFKLTPSRFFLFHRRMVT